MSEDSTHPAIRKARKVFIFVIGFTVLLLGVVMLVTPGPGVAVIFVGLGILATEFVWARYVLKKMKEKAGQVASKIRGEKAEGKDSAQRH